VAKRVCIAVLGVVAALAVVAGCGGDSDDDSLTKAEYTQQANAICQQGEDEKNKEIQAAVNDPKAISGQGQEGELELLTEFALPPIATMTEELSDLGGPSGEEEKAEALVEAFEEEIEKIEANPKSVISGSGGEFAEANKLAGELDLKACGLI